MPHFLMSELRPRGFEAILMKSGKRGESREGAGLILGPFDPEREGFERISKSVHSPNNMDYQIDAIGPACMGVQVGDPAYGLSDWFINGAQADYCLTVPANIAPKPVALDHTEAAAVPISALTAWQALIDRAQLSQGQRVLVHGAAGGVGSFAVQVACHKGAHVIATASAANADFVLALGADEVIFWPGGRLG